MKQFLVQLKDQLFPINRTSSSPFKSRPAMSPHSNTFEPLEDQLSFVEAVSLWRLPMKQFMMLLEDQLSQSKGPLPLHSIHVSTLNSNTFWSP